METLELDNGTIIGEDVMIIPELINMVILVLLIKIIVVMLAAVIKTTLDQVNISVIRIDRLNMATIGYVREMYLLHQLHVVHAIIEKMSTPMLNNITHVMRCTQNTSLRNIVVIILI